MIQDPIEERIEDLAIWVGMPTVCLTEKSKKKWVRVLGVLGMFVFFPLLLIGSFLIIVSMSIAEWKEI